MVDPKGRRPAGSPIEARPPNVAKTGSGGGWVAILIGVAALLAIGRCSSSTTSSSGSAEVRTASANAQEAIGAAITAQAPPPLEALSRASIRRGIAHLKLAASSEGLAGEMIYSQNCYDALSRHFAWAKLDLCGAFDAGAVQMLGDGDAPGFDKEMAWFDSETVAGRYLRAVTSAGDDADDADRRIGDLQARIARLGLAPKAQTAAPLDEQAPEGSAADVNDVAASSNDSER